MMVSIRIRELSMDSICKDYKSLELSILLPPPPPSLLFPPNTPLFAHFAFLSVSCVIFRRYSDLIIELSFRISS